MQPSPYEIQGMEGKRKMYIGLGLDTDIGVGICVGTGVGTGTERDIPEMYRSTCICTSVNFLLPRMTRCPWDPTPSTRRLPYPGHS